MKTTFKLLAGALIASSLIIGCKKYEEGPGLSLSSKTARVANTWTVEAFLINGVDSTSFYKSEIESQTFELKKDGKYTTITISTVAAGGSTDTENGTWEFINDKEDIKMLSDQVNAIADTLHVIKLKSNELWFTQKENTTTMEIHLTSTK